MQEQRQEIVRKQRKMFMRERSGNPRPINRHRSKDTNQTSPLFEPLSPKPKYMIMGLRDQLTTLREEVAKLSKMNKLQSPSEQQLSSQSEKCTPIQKKNMNSYYFESSPGKKTTQFKYDPESKTEGRTSPTTVDNPSPVADFQLIAEELRECQKQNDELRMKNQDLRAQMGQVGDQLRRQFQNKIKQMEFQKEKRAFSKERDNDRTVVIQKQNNEHKKTILQLREQVKQYQESLEQMKREIKQLKQKVLDMEKLQKQIKELSEGKLIVEKQWKNQAQTIVKMTETLQNEEKSLMNKQNELTQTLKKFSELAKNNQLLTVKLYSAEQKYNDLEKQCNLLKIKVDQKQNKKQSSLIIKQNKTIQDMQLVITMQQKSMDNYINDLQFLEKKLADIEYLKPLAQQLSTLVEEINDQCVKVRLELLNFKHQFS